LIIETLTTLICKRLGKKWWRTI